MIRPRALIPVPVLVAVVIGLGGCGPAVTGSSGGSSPHASRTAATADPLAGVESTVDAIEHDVDTDAESDAGTGR